MRIAEYAELDATALAGLIRAGEVTAGEVQNAAAAAIDAVEPLVHAVAGERFAAPLDHDPNGVFAGVPFAVKDLITHPKGVPMRNGSRILGAGIPFPYDNFLMTRFRQAGLATMAVTRTPELGFNATTEAVAYGEPTRNPWDLTRSAGGSSGGSAALVAARALPIAHANDGGGSIRFPAATCGLVGLKPSRGRTTIGPDYADPLSGMGIEFAVSRTVRDSARLLDAVHGSVPGDRYLLPPPERPYAEEVQRGSRPLRIALAWNILPPHGTLDPEVRAAVLRVAAQLLSMGHEVVEASPTVAMEQFLDANAKAWCVFLADGVAAVTSMLGIKATPDVLEHATLVCAEYGRSLTALDMMGVERVFNTVTRSVASFLLEYDVILSPTQMTPALPLGTLDMMDTSLTAQGWLDRLFSYVPTPLFNATGMPAITLPLEVSSSGLPIGMHFATSYAGESTLFALAGDLERAMPWAGREPKVRAR
jgi:amidase